MMLPFSMQCETCHTFLYRGRKYNSRKERMGGPDGTYLGITRWRFYIKCHHCARPISFLTDPKNADYEMEAGATRNYEIQRDAAQQQAEKAEETAEKEKLDPMKALEDRVLDSQREMADLDNLEEIKAMNARHVQLLKRGTDEAAVLGNANDEDEEKKVVVQLSAEDEALVKSIQFGKKRNNNDIRRLNETDAAQRDAERQAAVAAFTTDIATTSSSTSSSKPKASVLPVKIKRKVKAPAPEAPPKSQTNNTLSTLLGGYGSDSSDD